MRQTKQKHAIHLHKYASQGNTCIGLSSHSKLNIWGGSACPLQTPQHCGAQPSPPHHSNSPPFFGNNKFRPLLPTSWFQRSKVPESKITMFQHYNVSKLHIFEASKFQFFSVSKNQDFQIHKFQEVWNTRFQTKHNFKFSKSKPDISERDLGFLGFPKVSWSLKR